jgi:hypothetical protein
MKMERGAALTARSAFPALPMELRDRLVPLDGIQRDYPVPMWFPLRFTWWLHGRVGNMFY